MQVHGILTSEVSRKGRICSVLRVQGLSKLPQRVAFTVEYQQRHYTPCQLHTTWCPTQTGIVFEFDHGLTIVMHWKRNPQDPLSEDRGECSYERVTVKNKCWVRSRNITPTPQWAKCPIRHGQTRKKRRRGTDERNKDQVKRAWSINNQVVTKQQVDWKDKSHYPVSGTQSPKCR